MSKKTLKCNTCGYVACLDFIDDDGDFILPVKFAKTIPQVCKIYKEVYGDTYEHITGNKPTDDFYKQEVRLTHLDFQEEDNFKKHSLGEILCWRSG